MNSQARSPNDLISHRDAGGEGAVRTEPLKEIEAMTRVAAALSDVDGESAGRILRWAAERFGVGIGAMAAKQSPLIPAATPITRAEDLGEVFSVAAPEDGPQRALVVGYWLQVVKGQDDLEGQTINSELKNLGHALPNVTATLSLLMNQQPALVIQTRKIGSSKQGRKRYRLTTAGIARVRLMLESGSGV